MQSIYKILNCTSTTHQYCRGNESGSSSPVTNETCMTGVILLYLFVVVSHQLSCVSRDSLLGRFISGQL